MNQPKPKDPVLHNYPGRCQFCYMREQLCICNLIPEINNQTFVTVIMHQRESYKTTNTARLACMALMNSQILIRGKVHEPISQDDLIIENKFKNKNLDYKTQPLLLTLNSESQVLSKDLLNQYKKPVHLIVPDGNWRQANKMGQREPALKDIPWVKLPQGPPSVYRLRREHHPEGLSTLEAMARALTIIESPDIEEQLLSFFKVMVERTLSTRQNGPT